MSNIWYAKSSLCNSFDGYFPTYPVLFSIPNELKHGLAQRIHQIVWWIWQ